MTVAPDFDRFKHDSATPAAERVAGAPARSSGLRRREAGAKLVESRLKRALDIGFSLIALGCLAPLLVATAIAIKLDSAGPVIFKQRRVGTDGRIFIIYKLRTMSVMEDGLLLAQARREDARVTRVGQFLRRSSIDELPQFLNVLWGDMSVVGPRPHAVSHDEFYGALIPNYALRHQVKPGITGWAQISGLRGETAAISEMESRIKMDLWYIENWSFSLDLHILWYTCFEVIRGAAY